MIHPDDLDAFKQECNNCKVFECIDEGEYITLKYNNNCYRVLKSLFQAVPAPKYIFGDKVKIKGNEEAVITDIMWHYVKKEHYYFLSVGNKKKSRRYFDSDFI